jgi:uncharacterized membrane protein YadS
MLGPVVLFFALRHRHDGGATAGAVPRFAITRFVPWFVIGFLLLAGLRAIGVIPRAAAAPLATVSSWLTVAAMAALGLGVDLRTIRRVGRPVILTVTASLLVLVALGVTLIHSLSIR